MLAEAFDAAKAIPDQGGERFDLGAEVEAASGACAIKKWSFSGTTHSEAARS